ncbi:hypothetical protein QJQ45_011304 [Haematococcus lacustris]|nr:hypothetical protein QJQ45_011304 [Haematococcus lacustris]
MQGKKRKSADEPKLPKPQGLIQARRNSQRRNDNVKLELQHLAAATPAGTSQVAIQRHVAVTLATWDAVWGEYLHPKWAEQRMRLCGSQEKVLERYFNEVVERPNSGRPTDRLPRKVVTVDEFCTSRVSSAMKSPQPCEEELDRSKPTRPKGCKQQPGQVQNRLLRSAWSKRFEAPWRNASEEAAQYRSKSRIRLKARHCQPGPSTPLPAKRGKGTEAEQAAEPIQPTRGKGKAQGKAAKAKPAPQPGRWLDRDCNAALNMQRIGESKWRPLELWYWPEQGKLPAKGKEYPEHGYKRLRDKPPKAQQQQPTVAQ